MKDYISPIEEIIDEASKGNMFILVDAEDRENEGDLVIPAEDANADIINFMAKNGRGLICLALNEDKVEDLGLSLMSSNNKSRHETAFTVSIEAREGVTTGISAHDRALTISTAISNNAKSTDIVTPGHVFPIKARPGGVLVRAGHTEAAVDIAKLAGKNPSGVICEIMNDDGTMARLPELIEVAKRFNLKIGTIADLISYRINHDHIITRVRSEKIVSEFGGNWDCIVYKNDLDKAEHIALVKGKINSNDVIPIRVHSVNIFEDLISINPNRKNLISRSMSQINNLDSGVVILVRDTNDNALSSLLDKYSGNNLKQENKLKEYGVGAQILIDLGVKKMNLISDTNATPINLEGYDLEISNRQPLEDKN
tara:strand:- start:3834 stop:4940 length:1107 start_codon:yes stop_codon:yes gene_type:complete